MDPRLDIAARAQSMAAMHHRNAVRFREEAEVSRNPQCALVRAILSQHNAAAYHRWSQRLLGVQE